MFPAVGSEIAVTQFPTIARTVYLPLAQRRSLNLYFERDSVIGKASAAMTEARIGSATGVIGDEYQIGLERRSNSLRRLLLVAHPLILARRSALWAQPAALRIPFATVTHAMGVVECPRF